MATYEGRKRELSEALTRIQPTIPIDEQLSFALRLDQYITARDEALVSMCALIADTGDAKRETDVRDKLARGRDAFKDTLGNALSSIQTPSLPGLVFHNMVVADEDRFWKSLEKLNLGALRDNLMLRKEILKAYTENLKEKWETMTMENRPLLEAEKLATNQVIAWLDKSTDESANKMQQAKKATVDLGEAIRGVQRDTTEYCADLARKFAEKYMADNEVDRKIAGEIWANLVRELRPGDWLRTKLSTVLIGEFKDLPKHVLEALKIYAVTVNYEYTQRAATYRDNIRKQTDGIFAVFSQTRRDTDAFIKNNGFDVAKKQYQDAIDTLNRWVTDLPTDGLKKDGKDFSDAVIKGLSQHMTAMEQIFNNFIKENEGRFFGPLGPNIQQALAGEREWDDYLSKLLGRGRGVEEKLREWRNDAHQILEIDLENMLQMLKPSLPDQQEEIEQEFQQVIESVRDEVMREARDRIAEVDKIAEELKQIISGDKMLQDFDRNRLLEALRR
ncbi:MAG: hypothetical protein DMF64_20915 [Acidobacteria bacterium]|nr:MAG: hypothetical protein DMF64_20915 [Acidobacteriota bacterium]